MVGAQEVAFTGERPNGWATAAAYSIDIAEGDPSVDAGGEYERSENTGHNALPRAQAPPHRFDANAQVLLSRSRYDSRRARRQRLSVVM
jgi:hypothetical protein